MSKHTSGLAGHSMDLRLSGNEAAREGIPRAQRMAIRVRNGRPKRVPQLTPTPLSRCPQMSGNITFM